MSKTCHAAFREIAPDITSLRFEIAILPHSRCALIWPCKVSASRSPLMPGFQLSLVPRVEASAWLTRAAHFTSHVIASGHRLENNGAVQLDSVRSAACSCFSTISRTTLALERATLEGHAPWSPSVRMGRNGRDRSRPSRVASGRDGRIATGTTDATERVPRGRRVGATDAIAARGLLRRARAAARRADNVATDARPGRPVSLAPGATAADQRPVDWPTRADGRPDRGTRPERTTRAVRPGHDDRLRGCKEVAEARTRIVTNLDERPRLH